MPLPFQKSFLFHWVDILSAKLKFKFPFIWFMKWWSGNLRFDFFQLDILCNFISLIMKRLSKLVMIFQNHDKEIRKYNLSQCQKLGQLAIPVTQENWLSLVNSCVYSACQTHDGSKATYISDVQIFILIVETVIFLDISCHHILHIVKKLLCCTVMWPLCFLHFIPFAHS